MIQLQKVYDEQGTAWYNYRKSMMSREQHDTTTESLWWVGNSMIQLQKVYDEQGTAWYNYRKSMMSREQHDTTTESLYSFILHQFAWKLLLSSNSLNYVKICLNLNKNNKNFKCLTFWLSLSRKQGKSIYTLLYLKSQHNRCKKTALKVDAKIKISISSKYVKFWFLLAPFPKKRKKYL